MNSILEEINGLDPLSLDSVIESGKCFCYQPYDYLNFLKQSLENYNFEDDFNYLLTIFPIVSSLLCTTQVTKSEKQNMADLLKEIREKIQVLILQKPGYISKDNSNFSLLKDLINNTESLMIASFYDFTNYYQGNSLELMRYLLFELKDYNLVEDVLTNYPYMIRVRDQEGKSLLEEIISNYIEEIYLYTDHKELSTNFNLIYYEKVILLFLNHPKLEFSFKERKNAVSHIHYCRKNMIENQYNNLIKRKFTFWLNHLEEKLENKNHNTTFNEICYMHDIKAKFDEGILSEARRVNHEIKKNQYPNRKIIEDEYILTIDGDNASELDDALSIEKLEDGYYKLGIHIADPIGFLPENSIILDGAYERGSSIYLPNGTIFMFPDILAKDKMNLLQDKYRLATSYYLYINGLGIIENYEFMETVIKVSQNTTYAKVNETLQTGNNDDTRYLNTVLTLAEVTSKLSKNFKIDKIYSLVNRTVSNSTSTNIIEHSSSSKIVETCMMMANYIVPYHMNKNHLPCINRIHVVDQEYISKISSISSDIYSSNHTNLESVTRYLKSICPKGKYSIEAKGHFGLGLPHYSHVTSPLRRYSDVAMKLYVLNPFYFHLVSDREAYQMEERIPEVCKYINEKNIVIDSFVESYQKEKIKMLTKK